MISTVETYIGLMSGSSLDGVDLAEVSFVVDGQKKVKSYRIEKAETISYTPEWLERLLRIKEMQLDEFLITEADYSRYLGELINDFVSSDIYIDAIGLHGHTVIHIPENNITKQLGDGAIVASITNIDTVDHFRMQDIAHGGSGAPIAPTLDQDLFSEYDYLINLGGIANITVKKDRQLAGYDICPCNQLLNFLAQKLGLAYDKGGQIARNNEIDDALLEELHDHEYHHLPYPKSLDNQWITDHFLPLLDEAETGLSSATRYIAQQVAESMQEKGKALITGGGAHNSYLIELIKELTKDKEIEIVVPDTTLVDYKESLLMAYMAFKRKHEQVNVYSHYTGADSSTSSGAYYKAKT